MPKSRMMTEGISPNNLNQQFERARAIVSSQKISQDSFLNKMDEKSILSYMTPSDTYKQSQESRILNAKLLASVIEPDFASIQDRYDAWDAFSKMTMEEKVVTLVSTPFWPEKTSSQVAQTVATLLMDMYPRVEAYYRELILERVESNVEPFLMMIEELPPDDFLTRLVDDSESQIVLLQQSSNRVLDKMVIKTDQPEVFRNLIKEITVSRLNSQTVTHLQRQDNVRKWMPQSEEEKTGILIEEDLVEGIDSSYKVNYKIPYHIGKVSFPHINPQHGLAIVLHCSASMSKFHAVFSGLDIFRLPYTLSKEGRDHFFSKLIDRGFHNILVLMADAEVWSDYNDCKAYESSGVVVIDTKTAGLGLGMMLFEITKRLQENQLQVLNPIAIEDITQKLRHWVVLFNHHRIERRDWLQKYAYKAVQSEHNLCVMVNDARPNEGTWVQTLQDAFSYIKNEIENELLSPQKKYSRIVIIHESPYKDDIITFAYELRKISSSIPILVRHHAPRQIPFFGRHISFAMI